MPDTPDWIREALHHAAIGRNSHANSVKAVSGLTAEDSSKRPAKNAHSVWENLWHMVFWQRLLLDGVRGKPVQWADQIGKDFPSADAPESQNAWDDLVAEFAAGVEETQRLAMESDLSATIRGWGEMTAGYALTVAGTHTTYHIAQIIHTRIALGLWPPAEGT